MNGYISMTKTGRARGFVLAALALAVAGFAACSDMAADTAPATAPAMEEDKGAARTNPRVSTAPNPIGPVESPSITNAASGSAPGHDAGQAAAVPGADGGGLAQRIDFQDFTLLVRPVAEEADLVTVTVLYNGREVAGGDTAFRSVEPGFAREEFPGADCSSREIGLFTGGANCCYGYYLLSLCEGRAFAAYIEPYDGGLGQPRTLPDGHSKGFTAGDGTFMYYEPAGQSGAAPLSFSRASSPRLQRYLVFENGVWRADKPGEFASGYTDLLAELEESGDIDPAAKAITASYYTLMAGGDAAAAEDALKKHLPAEYAALGGTIFADVHKAVEGFRPVRELLLP
jgi:hypothetical protein